MFGQKPNIVESRIMSTTYGFGINHRFNPEGHPVEKKEVIEGVNWCKDCFVAIVKENDKVRVEETRKFLDYQPLQASQTSVSFKFYNSTDPNAKYTTDDAVGPSIGEVTIESPDISRGIDQKIDVCVKFGGTEIKATAIDKTSGNTNTVYLDFLCGKA